MREHIATLKKDLSNLDEILAKIDKAIALYDEDVAIDGKNIEAANIEQPSFVAYYDEIKVACKILLEYIDLKIRHKKGILFKHISLDSAYAHGERAIEKMIEEDAGFHNLSEKYLEVQQRYLMLESIISAFQQRSYSLTNIVKIREHELENITLHKHD
jgi:tetratricopeptide (TPR) repeat protein